ncbi:MAG TPA: serine hydrolase domain-containing protein, partial [Longimicrobiales bacterium]|nr:serine hydrolase domain-containing protein [Longimicrobiales bacterium]
MNLTVRAHAGRFAALCALVLACGNGTTGPAPVVVPPEIPITGQAVAGMESFDRIIRDLMRQHGIPGGAVAVVREGRLIYARGYGYADVEAKDTVQPDALFRIASVSKPITAVAILQLVEAGRIQLDDLIAPLIADLAPPP